MYEERNEPLSPRMVEIAELVRLGLSDKAIAGRLGLALGSVKQYLVRIRDRLPGEGSARHKLIDYWVEREVAERMAEHVA